MPRPTPGTPLHSGGGRFRSRVPVYFFVEGETEEDYIRHLGRRTAEYSFFLQKRHTDRACLVDEAVALRKKELKKDQLRDPDTGPRVWCVFDFDGDHRVDRLFQQAARHGVRIAFSHPCLELWWLLHFQAVTATLDAETIKLKLGRQSEAFRGLSKNKRLTPQRWEALRGLYPTACRHADRLISHCGCACEPPRHGDDCPPSKRSPSCNLAELVGSFAITY